MAAPKPSGADRTSSTGLAHLPPADVETTNWNAVKMLASKYGITLKSAAEVQSSAAARAQSTTMAGSDRMDASTDPEDLGVGSPFEITATQLEGGRFVYRFKWRGQPIAGLSEADHSDSGRKADGDEAEASGLPRSVSSNAVVGGKLSNGDQEHATGSQGKPRKPGNFMLKGSRSIPALRSKAAAAYSRPNYNGDAIIAGLPIGGLLLPSRANAPDERSDARYLSGSTAWRSFSSGSHGPIPDSTGKASIAMARAESTPVKGAHATRNWTGCLEEGDVLGAILGLRHEEVLTSVGPQTSARTEPSQTKQPTVTFEQSLPTLNAGDAPATDVALRADLDHAQETHSPFRVRPFGSDVLLHHGPSRKQDQSGHHTSPGAGVPPCASSSAEHEHVLPELDLGAKFVKSPRLYQLRQAPSFASTSSDHTARVDVEPRRPEDLDAGRLWSASFQGHHPEGSADILLYDVLQDYVRPTSGPSGERSTRDAAPRGDSASAHRRFNSADLLTTQLAQGNVDAQKHFIAEAQSLPTSAAPGDDPRFALWAIRSDRSDGVFVAASRDGVSLSRPSFRLGSPARASVPIKGGARRRSTTRMASGPAQFLESHGADLAGRNTSRTSSAEGSRGASSSSQGLDLFAAGKAVLLAATPARLVAEITSEIDQRLLTDFFYTYREYLEPTSLLRLLTLRFDWALAEPASAQDEARRRIVRVRTYVVIKYWLLHHFEFDFLPNRELRQGLANWLNRVVKDARMQSRPADLGIIKSLRKIVRGLKATYVQSGVGALVYNEVDRVKPLATATDSSDSLKESGGPVSELEGTRQDRVGSAQGTVVPSAAKSTALGSSAVNAADDVDLSFDADDVVEGEDLTVFASPRMVSGSYGRHASSSEALPATRTAAMKAAAESVVLSSPRQNATRLRPSAAAHSPNLALHSSHPPPLPHTQNTLSRVFVHTVGRLSRFKRVLGSRSTLLPAPGSADPSHDDLEFEAHDTGDLLFIRGGLENFMQHFNIDSSATETSTPVPLPAVVTETEDDEDERECMASDGTAMDETPSLSAASADHSTPASSIDLSPIRMGNGSPDSKAELGLGIRGITADTASELEDAGESAQPSLGTFDLELGSLGSLPSSKHLRRGSENLHHTTSDQTLRSFSQADELTAANAESALRVAPSRNSSRRAAPSLRWSVKSHVSGPRIVQIDDIDLSSDEDDGAVRRALRRLPGARDLRMANNVKDLETVRQSVDSMASSFAHIKTTEVLSISNGRPMSADALSLASASQPIVSVVHSEMFDPDEALQGYELVKGFQLDGFDSDDDEPGDVEAALRRLEGIIDEDKQREKAKKVEILWQKSLARNAEKDRSSSPPPLPTDEQAQENEGPRSSFVVRPDRSSSSSAASLADNEDEESSAANTSGSGTVDEEPQEVVVDRFGSFLDLGEDEDSTRRSRRASESSSLSYDEQRSPARSHKGMAAESGTVRQPRSRDSSTKMPAARKGTQQAPLRNVSNGTLAPPFHGSSTAGRPPYFSASRTTLSSKLGMLQPPPVHRSFLLSYRAEVVARQMCLIEAELLQAVSWDELAGSRWKERRYKCEVTDWESFYRDRVRDRLEAQKVNKTHHESAVEAIVARFNLTSNWVASEVVLTQNLDERVAVVSKLIRIAWKCYMQSNFASLAQIIFGLSTPWVERLRRTWSRVGFYEMRIWRDLNSFVGPKNNFRHLRNAMQAMAVDADIEDLISSAGPASSFGNGNGNVGGAGRGNVRKQGCIPFFGLFLSDLMINDLLPSHLDPSSPNSTVAIDSETGMLTELADPHAFDHLAPLPPSVKLEPLVNIYKYRVVSSTIKSVLAFQDRAKAYNFEADAGVYVKCLKIRCLQGEQLAKISHAAEP